MTHHDSSCPLLQPEAIDFLQNPFESIPLPTIPFPNVDHPSSSLIFRWQFWSNFLVNQDCFVSSSADMRWLGSYTQILLSKLNKLSASEVEIFWELECLISWIISVKRFSCFSSKPSHALPPQYTWPYSSNLVSGQALWRLANSTNNCHDYFSWLILTV